jgi:hypothetical protein
MPPLRFARRSAAIHGGLGPPSEKTAINAGATHRVALSARSLDGYSLTWQDVAEHPVYLSIYVEKGRFLL